MSGNTPHAGLKLALSLDLQSTSAFRLQQELWTFLLDNRFSNS